MVNTLQTHGIKGLKDLSRAPRRSPKKTPATLERKILDIRRNIHLCYVPKDTEELLAKAYCYQVYFNTQRKNSNKGFNTPMETLQAITPHVHPQVAVLPPVTLDNLIAHNTSPGYHVPVLTGLKK